MYNLLSWEYSRIWLNEHSAYHKNRMKNSTIPFIKPNVKQFVKSHSIKKKPPKSNFKMKKYTFCNFRIVNIILLIFILFIKKKIYKSQHRFENIEARIDHKMELKLKNRSNTKKQFTY